jgi:hypothetical protein
MPSSAGLISLLGLNVETLQCSETQIDTCQSTGRNISDGKKTLSRPVEEHQISQGRSVFVTLITLPCKGKG